MMRFKTRTRKTLAFLVLSLIFATIPLTVAGQPQYKDSLPDHGANFGCQYCHVSRNGGGPLNQFGKDFEENNLTYDTSLGMLDSDGDGFSNSQELDNRPVTNPGDSGSYPAEGGNLISILIFLAATLTTVIVGLVLIWYKR